MEKSINFSKTNIIINLFIIILELIGFWLSIKGNGFIVFEYYTETSNLLLLLSSLLFLVYTFLNYNKINNKIPMWLQILKYISAVSVTVTLVVVITVLSWSMPGGLIYLLTYKSMLYHHTLCPLLAIISFIFFEKYEINNNRQVLRALYFTFLYAIVIIPLNIFRIIEGPYPFLKVYNQPIWLSILWSILIIVGTFIIAKLLNNANKKFNK